MTDKRAPEPYPGDPADILIGAAPRRPWGSRGLWVYVSVTSTGLVAWVLWLSKGVWW